MSYSTASSSTTDNDGTTLTAEMIRNAGRVLREYRIETPVWSGTGVVAGDMVIVGGNVVYDPIGDLKERFMNTDNLEEEVKIISKNEDDLGVEYGTIKATCNYNNRVYRVNHFREKLNKGPLLKL